ncbi:MAG: hypothetical protein ACFFKA_15130 [Candidatus Thorarchaeota archaeon]
MKNKISFSSSPLTRITNSKYYDLEKTLDVMLKLWNYSIIQGFEFQHLAEWSICHPPKDTDPRYDRKNTWNKSLKYSISELATKVNKLNVPILSIHGNRDIGVLLCSDNREEVKNGKKLIIDSISLTKLVNANLCVFHIWDTQIKNFEVSKLSKIVKSLSTKFPNIILSIENIPTNVSDSTPFDLASEFDYITLDLRWCAVYDELRRFSKIKHKIVNIHIRGDLIGTCWKLKKAPFTIEEALNLILNEWNYKGILTFEPEGGLFGAKWEDLVLAITSIFKLFQIN